METRFLRNAITLGLLSAIGPFAIDMYLPALPDIGRNLHADSGAVQMSLTVFFIALSLGQSVYGPLSDMIGRKAPLYLGPAAHTCALVFRVSRRDTLGSGRFAAQGCLLALSLPLILSRS
jgi:DHA1 family bicyclomycin/chloramphenicol resistance-like MFS transporter